MTEVIKEAVEALHAALSYYSSIGNFRVGTPAEVIKHLAAKGFTITRSHSHKFADDMMSAGVKFDPSPDWNATVTITRAEPAPVGFDAAIKQLGEPDEATGHWSLDEGNLRWFVGQCRAKPAMSEAELEREAVKLSSSVRVGRDLTDEIMALAKKYRWM